MHTPGLSRFLQTSAVYLAIAAAPAAALDAGTSTTTSANTATTASGARARLRGSAQTAQQVNALGPSSRLFLRYRDFVGSDAVTRSLIQGLRYSEPVSLGGAGSAGGSSTLTPATRPMGWGSIDRALSLTQSELQSLGITQPSSTQLKTALTGGTLVAADGGPVAVQGVLTLRSQGMGWGQIAHAVGVSPGGKPGGMASSAAAQAMARTSPSASEPEATESGRGRVRVSIPAPSASASAGGDANAGHGVIVTAGGSIVGGTGVSLDRRSGSGSLRTTSGAGTGLDSRAGGSASAPGQGEANASSMAVIGGGDGNQFGSSIRAGVGGGLGFGRR